MEVYFKIGEIAEMFEISVRTLHLYDKMGLFKPEYTNESSGYRYYTADQIYKLNTILSFKKIGFSLPEIKRMFDNNLNAIDLIKMLKSKSDYFRQQIDIATFNIDNIERIIKAIESNEGIKSNDEITEQQQALRMSHIVCLENIKLENFFSEILWL